MIYLDYAANTPVSEEVLTCFCEASKQYIANPNSTHSMGRMANERLNACTAQILAFLELKDCEVIYTSGATESNNLAIKGIAEKYQRNGKHIITTYLEHSSVNGAVAALQNSGFEVEYVDIDENGAVDLNHLKALLRKDTILVSVCYVDSELGTQQPIEAISELLKSYPNCRFHVDATQAVGKIPVSLSCADLATFAPHKFYGLNGSGVLIKKEGVMLEPQIHGGISTTPYRSGTPALAMIAATARALELSYGKMAEKHQHVMLLNQMLRSALSRYPKIKLNSTDICVPYILNVSIIGAKTTEFIAELEQHEIYVSSKSACCAPNTVSRPVYAMTKDKKRALSTLRVSISHLTTEEEIKTFLEVFDVCYNKFVR